MWPSNRLPRPLSAALIAVSVALSAGAPAAGADATEAAAEFAVGKMLAEEGAYEEALEAFERTLELDGSALYARLELAEFHSLLAQISRERSSRRDHLDAALEHVEEARLLAPDNADVLRSYGQIQLQQVENDPTSARRAAEAFEKLHERGEADLQVLTSLGQIYLWQGQAARAAEVLQEAANSLPNHRTINAMLVQALVQSHDFERAEEALRAMVAVAPDSLDHRMRLVELLSQRGEHGEAVAVLREGPAEIFEEHRVRYRLARELHLAGENEAALAEVDALIAEAPERESTRRLRVDVLSELLRYDEAIRELGAFAETAREDGSGRLEVEIYLSRLLERVGRSAEAAEGLRTALAESSEAEAARLRLALAEVLMRDGRASEAVEILSGEVERAKPEDLPPLAAALADALESGGHSGEAARALEKAARRLEAAQDDESAARLRLRRASILAREGRRDELLRDTASLARGASGSEMRLAARRLRAEALAELGRLDEALAEFDVAGLGERYAPQVEARQIEFLLRFGRAEEGRRRIEALLGDRSVEELLAAAQVFQRAQLYGDVVPLLEEALERGGESVPVLFLLASARERGGDHDAAVAAFERLLALEPDHAPSLNYLGYIWADAGENLERALDLIERAVVIDPDNGAYADSLGWAYYRLGRYDQARRHLEWAARLVPEDPTIFEHLGDLYHRLGEVENARQAYHRALELEGKESERVRDKLERLDGSGG